MKRRAGIAAMFDTLLVAHRGEIALRILRSARALGLRTIAVHTHDERDAPHLAEADEAIELRADSALAAYRSIDAIVDACRRSGAGAVHPGYGFLSENAAFVRACDAAGVVFVGPAADTIETLGDKARAKRLAEQAGLPCLPGYAANGASPAALAAEARRIGMPLMIKAAAGGGGRGLRRVDSLADFDALRQAATDEATATFGDGTLLLERCLDGARHVEVQILADRFGACVHLGGRDCSTQRRHQKLVEEAPAPGVAQPTRAAMGEAAVRLMREAGYVGAGTVEFLLAPDGDFRFLEVNPRLQVEHRVTEAVTGIDLVEIQLRIARGEPLPFTQEEIHLDGHAIEARLCAEDAFGGFVPQAGRIAALRLASGDGVRIDHALAPGIRVSPHFDSLLAKFVAHGRDREQARTRLVAALARSSILGVATNRGFLLECLRSPHFGSAEIDTGWLARAAAQWRAPSPDATWQAVASVLWLHEWARSHGTLANWSPNGSPRWRLSLAMTGSDDDASQARAEDALRWDALIEARADAFAVTVGSHERLLQPTETGSVRVAGRLQPVHVVFDGPPGRPRSMWLDHAGFAGRVVDAGMLAVRRADTDARTELRAGMHGRILSIAVATGERVCAGQTLLSIEAMKMEHRVVAPADGRVAALAVRAGTQVSPATLLARIEPEASA